MVDRASLSKKAANHICLLTTSAKNARITHLGLVVQTECFCAGTTSEPALAMPKSNVSQASLILKFGGIKTAKIYARPTDLREISRPEAKHTGENCKTDGRLVMVQTAADAHSRK